MVDRRTGRRADRYSRLPVHWPGSGPISGHGRAPRIGPPQARNIYGYKSYTECAETSHFLAWRPIEYHWYCTSLAFNT
jgi:hypothetical protein